MVPQCLWKQMTVYWSTCTSPCLSYGIFDIFVELKGAKFCTKSQNLNTLFLLFIFLYRRQRPHNLVGLLNSDTVKFQIKVVISMVVLSSDVMNFILVYFESKLFAKFLSIKLIKLLLAELKCFTHEGISCYTF